MDGCGVRDFGGSAAHCDGILVDFLYGLRQGCGVRLLWVFLSLTVSLSASVREVVQVFQPLSFHGTDSAESFGENQIQQAGIRQSAMIVTGAMPETLILAVGQPSKLSVVGGDYPFTENNLLALCGIEVTAIMEDGLTVISLDLESMKIPEEVDLEVRRVLSLGIEAIEATLRHYYQGAIQAGRFEVQLTGLSEATESLRDLGREIRLKK